VHQVEEAIRPAGLVIEDGQPPPLPSTPRGLLRRLVRLEQVGVEAVAEDDRRESEAAQRADSVAAR
jgi:hypothetical protein